MTATIPGRRCTGCARTRRYDYDPGHTDNQQPGTHAEPGDLRRCDHGRIWVYLDTVDVGGVAVDVWERLSPVWTPVRHRRAAQALRSMTASERNTP